MEVHVTSTGHITIDGEDYNDLETVPGTQRVQKIASVPALQVQKPFELKAADGQSYAGNAGDWLLKAGPSDIYLVKDEVFRQLYRLITD